MSTANQRVQGLVYYVTNKGLLVANRAMNYGSVRSTLTANCLINDKPLKPTFNSFWYFIEGEKEIVSYKEKGYDRTILKGYELSDPSMFIEHKIPLTLSLEDVESDYDEDGDLFWNKHASIRSLYKEVRETVKGEYKELPFEAECFGVVEGDISEPLKTTFNVIQEGCWGKKDVKAVSIDSIAHYSELDKILTPEFAIHNKPCFLTSKQTYDIVRTFVKDNIDPKQAIITSDYDFCFTVKKKVTVKPWIKKTEITKRNGHSYATPKFKTQTVDHKQVEIFEMTHEQKGYQNYTIIKGFKGHNLENLVENIKAYLEDLIAYINAPVSECECCQGTGHIVKQNFDMNNREYE